jgi:hypothetical protein
MALAAKRRGCAPRRGADSSAVREHADQARRECVGGCGSWQHMAACAGPAAALKLLPEAPHPPHLGHPAAVRALLRLRLLRPQARVQRSQACGTARRSDSRASAQVVREALR